MLLGDMASQIGSLGHTRDRLLQAKSGSSNLRFASSIPAVGYGISAKGE